MRAEYISADIVSLASDAYWPSSLRSWNWHRSLGLKRIVYPSDSLTSTRELTRLCNLSRFVIITKQLSDIIIKASLRAFRFLSPQPHSCPLCPYYTFHLKHMHIRFIKFIFLSSVKSLKDNIRRLPCCINMYMIILRNNKSTSRHHRRAALDVRTAALLCYLCLAIISPMFTGACRV